MRGRRCEPIIEDGVVVGWVIYGPPHKPNPVVEAQNRVGEEDQSAPGWDADP